MNFPLVDWVIHVDGASFIGRDNKSLNENHFWVEPDFKMLELYMSKFDHVSGVSKPSHIYL